MAIATDQNSIARTSRRKCRGMITKACSIRGKEAMGSAPEFRSEALCPLPHPFPFSSVVEAFLRGCVRGEGIFSDETGDGMGAALPP